MEPGAGFIGTIAMLFVATFASIVALLVWMAAISIGHWFVRSKLWQRIGTREF
jgi:hypothetical protein